MTPYLIRSKLTADGMSASMSAGGEARREVVARAMESLGGKLLAFYYSSGGTEVWSIALLPDQAAVVAGTASAHVSGLATVEVVELIDPSVIDEAARRQSTWTAPD